MKDEYDFSNAERGKFYRPGAQLIPPVHLDPEILNDLSARAEARGKSLSELEKRTAAERHRTDRSCELAGDTEVVG